MSPNPDQSSSSPDRLTRPPTRLSSLRSSHRSSTKAFVRLRGGDEIQEVYREVPKRSTMRPTGASTLGEDWDVIQPPKLSWRPRSNERQKNGQSQGQVDVRLRSKSACVRTKMRANPPRPKGPRKAGGSVSSLTTPLVEGCSIRQPAASFQPARLPYTVFNSSGTLDIRNVESSVPLSWCNQCSIFVFFVLFCFGTCPCYTTHSIHVMH